MEGKGAAAGGTRWAAAPFKPFLLLSLLLLSLLLSSSSSSCRVIVRNRLSLSMGSRGVAAGANPSLVSGRGQGAPWTSHQLIAGPH